MRRRERREMVSENGLILDAMAEQYNQSGRDACGCYELEVVLS